MPYREPPAQSSAQLRLEPYPVTVAIRHTVGEVCYPISLSGGTIQLRLMSVVSVNRARSDWIGGRTKVSSRLLTCLGLVRIPRRE